MSVWKLEIDLSFKSENDMKSMLNLIEAMFDKLADRQEGLPINQNARYHECFHDEGMACGGYTAVEFDGATDHGVPAEDVIPEAVKTKIKKEPAALTGATI